MTFLLPPDIKGLNEIFRAWHASVSSRSKFTLTFLLKQKDFISHTSPIPIILEWFLYLNEDFNTKLSMDFKIKYTNFFSSCLSSRYDFIWGNSFYNASKCFVIYNFFSLNFWRLYFFAVNYFLWNNIGWECLNVKCKKT